MECTRRAALAAVFWLVSSGLQAGEPGWSIARSPHFTVVGPTGEGEVRDKAYELEQFHGLVSSALNLRAESTRPVVVFAVPGEPEMRAALGNGSDGKPAPAGFFRRGDTHQIVVRLDTPGDGTLYHEYVHLLNSLNFGRLPLWLDEGLAGFYSTAVLEDDRVRYAQVSQGAIAVLRGSPLLPLPRLFAVDHGSPEYGGTHRPGMFHVQSALLTHYFMMGERGAHRRMLAEYLNQLAAGATDEQAEQRAFGGAAALDKAFSSYARSLKFFSVRANGTFDPKAITTGPLSGADALAYQALLEIGGREERGRELAERAVAADPKSALAQRALGQALANDRPAEAIAALERSAAADRADLMTHYYLGTISNGDDPGDAARRERSLRAGLAIQPKHAPSRAALARLARSAGRMDEALGNATVAFDAEPQEPQFTLLLADILRAVGRGPEAEAVEGRVVQAAHTDPAKLAAAEYYLSVNDREKDRDALMQKTLAAKPRSAPVLRLLGQLFHDAGRQDDEEAVYRLAISVNPQDAYALNALGYLYADRNVKVPEALGLIEAALKVQPESPDVLDSRGWVLFRLKRLPEAERDLRKAAALSPHAQILDHLGQVLAARGATAEARAEWTRALAAPGLTLALKTAIEGRMAGASPVPTRP